MIWEVAMETALYQFPEIKTIRLKIVSLLSNMNGMQKLGL
jgi:hypothetical protein